MIKEWKELYFDGTELVDPYELAERIYRENENVLPDRSNLFKAFELTKPQDVKVVIIGQDPYHTPGQAQGLSFSLPNDAPTQPSLKNILKELEADTGIKRKETDLTSWANQGVLLLNSALTVLQGQPGAHKNMGWNLFTKKITLFPSILSISIEFESLRYSGLILKASDRDLNSTREFPSFTIVLKNCASFFM